MLEDAVAALDVFLGCGVEVRRPTGRPAPPPEAAAGNLEAVDAVGVCRGRDEGGGCGGRVG